MLKHLTSEEASVLVSLAGIKRSVKKVEALTIVFQLLRTRVRFSDSLLS